MSSILTLVLRLRKEIASTACAFLLLSSMQGRVQPALQVGGQVGIDVGAELAQLVSTQCPAVGEWRQKLKLARHSSTPKRVPPKELRRYINCRRRPAQP